MNQPKILEDIYRNCNYKSYLELGVSYGLTLSHMSKVSNDCIGVDLSDIRIDKSTNFYLGSTNNFFKQNIKKYDLIFIDACHDIDYVVQDFENSIKVLNFNGIIILHDTDPETKELTNSNFCSDAYKFRELYENKYEMITLPSENAGLTLVKEKNIFRYKLK